MNGRRRSSAGLVSRSSGGDQATWNADGYTPTTKAAANPTLAASSHVRGSVARMETFRVHAMRASFIRFFNSFARWRSHSLQPASASGLRGASTTANRPSRARRFRITACCCRCRSRYGDPFVSYASKRGGVCCSRWSTHHCRAHANRILLEPTSDCR